MRVDDSGCRASSPATKTAKATVAGGIATVDFTANPVQVVGTDQTLAIAQVVYTATQQPGVTGRRLPDRRPAHRGADGQWGPGPRAGQPHLLPAPQAPAG